MKIEIIKLHSLKRVDIKQGSSPRIEVDVDTISIPNDAYGQFFIRNSLNLKGLINSGSVFHPNWEGTPNVVVHNSGHADVELRQGEELGELWIFKGVTVGGKE